MNERVDVVFGQGGGRDLRLDIYEPAGDRLDTAVLLLHGGGWSRGDRTRVAEHARHLARQGFVAISSEYRLTGEAPWPAQIHDTKTAIRWVRSHADELGFDPAKICLQGHSAGAHLALLAAGTVADPAYDGPDAATEVPASVAAVAAIYPPTLFFAGEERPSGGLAGRVLLGDGGSLEDAEWASPIEQVGPDFPPTMLLHGDTDTVVPFSASLRMWERLRDAGVPVDVALYAGLPHGFANWPSILGPMESSIAMFFNRHVATPLEFQAELEADAQRQAAARQAAPAS